MKIQWYPGHVARARREIKDHLKLVDIVIEVIDARCPKSSINFLSDEIKDKKRLLIFNKSDLADDKKTKMFVNEYIGQSDARTGRDPRSFVAGARAPHPRTGRDPRSFVAGDRAPHLRTGRPVGDINTEVLCLDSRKNDIKKLVDKKIDKLCDDIIAKYEKKGISNVTLKAMVVGMPNVGKSTFINSYVKKKVNNVANTPGVTKHLKWSKVSEKLLLLDTPGVTVPKFESEKIGTNLALVGSLNDDIVEKQDLAYEFIDIVKNEYFDLLKCRYKLKVTTADSETIDIMNEISKNTECLKKGGEYNYDKVSNLILTDFRKGLIGRITLDE